MVHISVTKPPRLLKVLAVISAVGMALINLVGFLDTQTNSALGCGPDWPLCNGQVVPNLNNEHVLIEFGHRMIVGGFAVIATIFMIWAWRRYRDWVEARIFAIIGIGFIIVQSILGALAVLFVNPPAILALHLGFGFLAMVGVALLTAFLWQMDCLAGGRPAGLQYRSLVLPKGLVWRIWIVWVYTYLALYLGSYVAFRSAGEACTGWPLCNGQIIPPLYGNIGLDFAHRVAAVILAILVLELLWQLRKQKSTRPDLYRGAGWLVVVVFLQIITGANLALSHLGTGPYMLHVGNLMLLFTLVSYLAVQSLQPVPKAQRWMAEPQPSIAPTREPRHP